MSLEGVRKVVSYYLTHHFIGITKGGYMKGHWDTLAIIGVNLAVASILTALCLSHNSQIAATNARIDATYVMIYDILKEGRK